MWNLLFIRKFQADPSDVEGWLAGKEAYRLQIFIIAVLKDSHSESTWEWASDK